ncbi:MAG: BamA/TamA family outer membrane protein [Myxococcota bacterium]
MKRLLFVAAAVGLGCAHIPSDRYGVDRLNFEGVDEMDGRALRACLATSARSRVEINLGASAEPTCGEPPFDAGRLRVPLWRWPWADWPTYDRNVFERDLQRIERWYRARGFYEARVTAATFDPPIAATNDRVLGPDGPLCDQEDDDEGCRLNIRVTVEEGEPVLVRTLALEGTDTLGEGLQRRLIRAWELEEGERFDEALYDRSKRAMLRALHDKSYGCAEIESAHEDERAVVIDPEERTADIALRVLPGPRSRLGRITVTGNEDLSESVIRSVADLETGMDFTEELLDEAQHFVYSLGAFSSVDVIGDPIRNEAGTCTGVVDVEIRVTPGRRFRFGLGGGVLAGTYTVGQEDTDVRQWDVHGLGFIEHRNFLGGLRRMRLEARPRLIFQPQNGNPVANPRPGIELRLQFRQPSFIESRTNLVSNLRYEFGPDPNDLFFRHNLNVPITFQRTFFDGRFSLDAGPSFDLFRVPDGDAPVADFELAFVELGLQLDLRNDTRRPTKGVFVAAGVQVARFLSWDYIRFVPDLRLYAPLGGRVVAAGRFRLGVMHITRAADDLDAVSRTLGPQLYRLRSGGASSHRGFLPGFLGDPPSASGDPENPFQRNSGGLRRWEGSLELRVRVTEDFGLAFFGDVGDVNREASFRFDYIHLAVGGGLRYDTIVGPLRFDIGWRVRGAQVIGGEDPSAGSSVRLFGIPINGAFHLTIGEAF